MVLYLRIAKKVNIGLKNVYNIIFKPLKFNFDDFWIFGLGIIYLFFFISNFFGRFI